MVAALIGNLFISGIEIAVGTATLPFGAVLLAHGKLCLVVDVAFLFGMSAINYDDEEKGISLDGTTVTFESIAKNFDPDEVILFDDLLPKTSPLVNSYRYAKPPTQMPVRADNIEIHNITVAGPETYNGGGWGIHALPWEILFGIWQPKMYLNITWDFLTEWGNPVNALTGNNPMWDEAFLGLLWDALGLTHEPGAFLFPISYSFGNDLNVIRNNSAATTYRIDVTTARHNSTQKLLGNNSPDRQLLYKERILNDPERDPFTGSHAWSQNTLFHPLGAIIEDPSFFAALSGNRNYLYFNYLNGGNPDPIEDVSQITRTMKIIKENGFSGEESNILPELNYMETSVLKNNPYRDFYHYFMYGYNGGRAPQNFVVSKSITYGNTPSLNLAKNVPHERGLYSACIPGPDSVEDKKGVSALDSMIFTNYVKVLPLSIYNYYEGLNVSYSINGTNFMPSSPFADITGYPGLDEYGNHVKDNEQPASSLVYDNKGQTLLVSPHFKEGFNSLVFRFADPFGGMFYKDMQIMQLTVPPFIKPVYPLMNQYVGSGTVHAQVQALDISDGAVKPETWFEDAVFTIKIDGNPVYAYTRDQDTYTVSFDLNGLSDGNHQVEFTVDVYGLENTQSWRFWVDTTPPEIRFPEKMIFSNREEQNSGGVAAHISDTVPYRTVDPNYKIDTVFLSDLKINITNYGVPVHEVPVRDDARYGAYASSWNGWNNGYPLSHGIYSLEVEATDRVGNYSDASTNVIIDNMAPVFENININTYIVNLNSGLLDLSYRLGLDEWETHAGLDIEIMNLGNNEVFNLSTEGQGNTGLSYTLAYFVGGINVFKDGLYDIRVHAVDELDNRSNPVVFSSIVVDRTKPGIIDAYANPFVLDTDTNQISLKFTATEEYDASVNLSSTLEVRIEVLDQYGEPVDSIPVYSTVMVPGSDFENRFDLPASLRDGKYFFEISVEDKNGNKNKEMAAFIKNAMPPEITHPSENDFIDGITTIHGNVLDPGWDNDLPFFRYELYYRFGYFEVPENTTDLTEWESDAVKVPLYQKNEDWPSNYGRFTVDGGNVIGSLDTAGFPDGLITLLLVSEEEGGYRIGTTRTFRILKGGDAFSVDIEIDPDFEAGPVNFDFNSGDELSVEYTVNHDIENPVDIFSHIKDSSGRIIKRWSFYNLQSMDIKGAPDILPEENGVFIYQEGDNRFNVYLQNAGEDISRYFLILDTTAEMSDFVDMDGSAMETPVGLIDNGKKLMVTRTLAPGECRGFSFSIPGESELSLTATIDNALSPIYIGKNKTLHTSGTVTVYPGSDYPPVIWDGKDEWGRYMENGPFSVGIEAFGRNGGQDEDSCNVNIETPFLFNIVNIDNMEVQPGIDSLDRCSVLIHLNKPGSVSVSVFDAGNNKIRDIIPEPEIFQAAENVCFTWYGDNNERQILPEGPYYFRIICNASDGSSPIIADAGTHPELGITLSLSKNINPDIKAELFFEGAQEYNGKDLIQGDSGYLALIQANGQYLPDRNVTMELEGKGTQIVEAYPDMNYMAAFITNYSELWAGAMLNSVKLTARYRYSDWFWGTHHSNVGNRTLTLSPNITERKVISYNVETNKISKNRISATVTITGTVTVPGYVRGKVGKRWSISKWKWVNVYKNFDFQKINSLYSPSGEVKYGSEYMGDVRLINRTVQSNTKPNTSSSSYQTIYVTIRGTLECDVRNKFDYTDYLSLTDGVAVMSPDIVDTDPVYANWTPFVHKGVPVSLNGFITDPKASTGMQAADKTANSWRKNPNYYFYYAGENYENPEDQDEPKTSVDGLLDYTEYPVANPLSAISAQGVQRYCIPENFSSFSELNGKIGFTLNRTASNNYNVTVQSLAKDRICYPFPASENGFTDAHFIGDPLMGIPETAINSTRNNQSKIPNYCISEFKLGEPSERNVFFGTDTNTIFLPESTLKYNEDSGYGCSFSLIGLNTDISDILPESVNIKKWTINDLYSDDGNIIFKDLTGKSISNDFSEGPAIEINDTNIESIAGSLWTLGNDSLVPGNTLYSQKRDIDLDALNRHGVLKDIRISESYPFSIMENTDLFNMFHTDNNAVYTDNSDIVINPDIRDYSNTGSTSGYEISLIGLDGEVYSGLGIKETAYFGKGNKLSDGYIIELSEQSPVQLLPVYGEGEGDIRISYLNKTSQWMDIPVYNKRYCQKDTDILGCYGP